MGEHESNLLALKSVPCCFLPGNASRLEALKAAGFLAARYKVNNLGYGLVFPRVDLGFVPFALGLPSLRIDKPLLRKKWPSLYLVEPSEGEMVAPHTVDPTGRAYVLLCRQRVVFDQQMVGETLDSLHQEADALWKELVALERQIEALTRREQEIDGLRHEGQTPTWLIEEFARLRNLPDVQEVFIDPGKMHMVVATNMLYGEETIEGRVRYFELGKFELVITPKIGELRMFNRTHRKKSQDSPHVREGVCGCYGPIGPGLVYHLARAQYAVVAEMLIGFLTLDSRGGFKYGGWREVPQHVARPLLTRAARARRVRGGQRA